MAAYLELDSTTVQAIKKQGLSFFEEATTGRDGDVLQDWMPTPLAREDGGFRDTYAFLFSKCYGNEVARTESSQLWEALQESGAYFTTFNHGEGLLVIDPDRALAGSFYHG